MNRLGLLYAAEGRSAEDHAFAQSMFQKAADKGFAAAQTNLAALYMHGHCMKTDLVAAYAWLELAAKGGDAKGKRLLEQLKGKINRDQLNQATERAQSWEAAHPGG